MTSYARALAFTLKKEGGLTRDAGGLTNHGISQRSFPSLDIATLTKEDAEAIYLSDYWFYQKCHEMRESLAMTVFDSSVNCGRHRTTMWIQAAIKARGISIEKDGVLGPITLRLMQRVNMRALMQALFAHRLLHYSCLRKKQPEHYGGWVIRVTDLMMVTLY